MRKEIVLAKLYKLSINFFGYIKEFHTESLYNDVNNQQDATTFSFIDLFKSALHVLGDKFAHPQEHFLTVYTVKKCS